MRLSKSKDKKRFVIILTIVIIGAVGLAYLWFRSTAGNKSVSPTSGVTETRKVNDVDYSPPTDEDKKQQAQQKDEVIQQATGGTHTTDSITVSISRATQSGAGQPLVIRTIVGGLSSGTCDVTLTRSGQATVVKTFEIAAEATYSTCTSAQIPVSSFPTGGDWKLQVVARDGAAASSQPAVVNVTIAK